MSKLWVFRTWLARVIAPWMEDGCRQETVWEAILGKSARERIQKEIN
jgi:hypothetical protein